MSSFPMGQILFEAVAQALMSKAVDIGWEALQNNVNIGSLLLEKGGRFEMIQGTLSRLWRSNKSQAELLRIRNEQLSRFYTLYANEPTKLSLGNNIRVAYAHQLWLIPQLQGSIDPDYLRASQGALYHVDSGLNITGYQDVAKQFRAANDPKKEQPFKGTTVRISAWDGNKDFTLSYSYYYDQYVTNQKEIVDVPLEQIVKGTSVQVPPKILKSSLRELNMQDGRLLPFDKSPLANSIGVGATVITSDGYLVLPKRNRQVHFQSGYEGCSTSGVLEWSDNLVIKFMDELKRQIATKEGPQEILLDPESIVIHPLAFAREFERAGKPQFFFHIWTSQRLEEFKQRWKVSKYAREEFDSIRWIEMYEPGVLQSPEKAIDQMIERILALLSTESYIKLGDGHQIVLSEEVRANLYYLLIFLQSNRANGFPHSWIA